MSPRHVIATKIWTAVEALEFSMFLIHRFQGDASYELPAHGRNEAAPLWRNTNPRSLRQFIFLSTNGRGCFATGGPMQKTMKNALARAPAPSRFDVGL